MLVPSDRPIVHGIAAFVARRCRCEVCRSAHREYYRLVRERKGIVPLSQRPLIHGRSAYSNGRCRCEICRKAQLAYINEHRRKHPEWWKQHYRKQSKTEKNRARIKTWCQENSDHLRDQARARYAADPESAREKTRRWRGTPQGQITTASARMARRAREANAIGQASATQIRARIDYYGGRCWICRALANTIDHVIPLARGGTGWPANLRPACKRCNFSRQHRGVVAC